MVGSTSTTMSFCGLLNRTESGNDKLCNQTFVVHVIHTLYTSLHFSTTTTYPCHSLCLGSQKNIMSHFDSDDGGRNSFVAWCISMECTMASQHHRPQHATTNRAAIHCKAFENRWLIKKIVYSLFSSPFNDDATGKGTKEARHSWQDRTGQDNTARQRLLFLSIDWLSACSRLGGFKQMQPWTVQFWRTIIIIIMAIIHLFAVIRDSRIVWVVMAIFDVSNSIWIGWVMRMDKRINF